ncbi:MAG: S26 family signal peptidase [Flavobacteriales bacterium]|nr:S26 family signal peptidase [Flavobacteriales bacterium]
MKPKNKKNIKSKIRGWLDAIVFAVIAASIIRIFFIEAYTIPTPSMEGSMLVGDFLFVSKIAYGPRVPMTPVAFPLVHNKMPLMKRKSYIKGIKYPYKRLKGLGQIKRNDCVVFNFPADSLGHPIDKKDNYVKRCVGLPGDYLEIKNKDLFINGKIHEEPEGMKKQYLYDVRTKSSLNSVKLKKMGLLSGRDYGGKSGYYGMYLDEKKYEKIVSEFPNITNIKKRITPPGLFVKSIFPNDVQKKWNNDNYGEIWIPKKGEKITIDKNNVSIYKGLIEKYEEYEITKIPIDYTFKMNYYWMMGDNRDNSLDSRSWGFVPENHIVGKASFIWMSVDKDLGKIRWNRIFNAIK